MKTITKLRFREFNTGWEEKQLKEVAIKIQDGTHFSPQVDSEGDFLYLTSKNIKNGFVDLNNSQFINRKAHENIYKRCDVKKGDVLITKDGTIGQVCVNELNQEFSLLSSVAFLRPHKEYSNYFIYQLLVSPVGQKEIESQIAGQALKRITLTKINNFKFFFPTLPEQQKISSFLTSVDTKIQQLTKKKTLLEQYKKGVMQKIFNKEIRFKDENGKAFPEWEEKNLGDVSEVTMGQSPNSSSYNNEGTGIPLVQGNADIKDRVTNPRNWTSEPTKVCDIGDLILTVRAPVGAVAKSMHHACIGRGVCAIRNNKKTEIEFLYQFLLDYELKWGSIEQGSTFTAVSGTEIKKIEIKVPTIKEQKKIASFLSALDIKIRHTETVIEKTKLWKKGLLQQLFV